MTTLYEAPPFGNFSLRNAEVLGENYEKRGGLSAKMISRRVFGNLQSKFQVAVEKIIEWWGY